MAKYIVKRNQNIFDIAIHLYGSIEGLFDLLISNRGLSLSSQLNPGDELEYHDYFVVNRDIEHVIKEKEYVPANGENHVYPKSASESLRMICEINDGAIDTGIKVSGSGYMVIDWGDNSELERVDLSNIDTHIVHQFDNHTVGRIMKIYSDNAMFNLLDVTKINGSVFPVKPIVVDEYINHTNGLAIYGLLLFDGTYYVDLQNCTISDLSPIYDMNLQELNLKDVSFTSISVLDNFLIYMSSHVQEKPSCKVTFSVHPSADAEDAMLTLSDAGWEFINDTIENGKNIN